MCIEWIEEDKGDIDAKDGVFSSQELTKNMKNSNSLKTSSNSSFSNNTSNCEEVNFTLLFY